MNQEVIATREAVAKEFFSIITNTKDIELQLQQLRDFHTKHLKYLQDNVFLRFIIIQYDITLEKDVTFRSFIVGHLMKKIVRLFHFETYHSRLRPHFGLEKVVRFFMALVSQLFQINGTPIDWLSPWWDNGRPNYSNKEFIDHIVKHIREKDPVKEKEQNNAIVPDLDISGFSQYSPSNTLLPESLSVLLSIPQPFTGLELQTPERRTIASTNSNEDTGQRKRGRPKKNVSTQPVSSLPTETESAQKRRPGRPRKASITEPPVEEAEHSGTEQEEEALETNEREGSDTESLEAQQEDSPESTEQQLVFDSDYEEEETQEEETQTEEIQEEEPPVQQSTPTEEQPTEMESEPVHIEPTPEPPIQENQTQEEMELVKLKEEYEEKRKTIVTLVVSKIKMSQLQADENVDLQLKPTFDKFSTPCPELYNALFDALVLMENIYSAFP